MTWVIKWMWKSGVDSWWWEWLEWQWKYSVCISTWMGKWLDACGRFSKSVSSFRSNYLRSIHISVSSSEKNLHVFFHFAWIWAKCRKSNYHFSVPFSKLSKIQRNFKSKYRFLLPNHRPSVSVCGVFFSCVFFKNQLKFDLLLMLIECLPTDNRLSTNRIYFSFWPSELD